MILENAPVFSAAGDGLSAPFAINFAADITHSIPCEGTWQGDRKECKSLYIDNYNNDYSINVQVGGGSVRCPAYSQGYVTLTRNSNVIVTADVARNVVNMTLHTAQKAEGFTARGNAPAGLGGDPYFDYVMGLYHFEGQNGALATEDNAIEGFGTINMNSGTALSTGYQQFGTSALRMDTHVTASCLSSTGTQPIPPNFTIEFLFVPIIQSSAPANILIINGATSFQFNYIPVGANQYRISSLVGTSNLLMNVGSPVYVAFVSLGNYSMLYLNGVLDSSSGVGNGGGNGQIVCQALAAAGAFTFYLDELRLTAFPRYTKNYTVQTAPFPDS